MKLPRLRLSTLMLLIIIAAFAVALVVQARRAALRGLEMEARLSLSQLALAEIAVMNREMEKRAIEIKNNKQ
jgi:hypothetical protein